MSLTGSNITGSNITEQEIASQPGVWAGSLGQAAQLGAILRAPGQRMLIVGCGTSAFMARSLAALRETAGLGETDWAYASEVSSRRYDRVIAVTRSGTTTEVIDCLEAQRGSWRGVIASVPGSPAAARADAELVLELADEASVVQTRFPTTLLFLARVAFGEDVDGLVAQCEQALAAPLPAPAERIDHVVYLGSGWTIGLAYEAALKIREAAQAWAESYPALDYRHGPIAVAGDRTLVWVFGPTPPGLADDIRATGAGVADAQSLAPVSDPLAQLVLAQRFAVAMARRRGLDPDRPRHLTRSVILDVQSQPQSQPLSHPKGNS